VNTDRAQIAVLGGWPMPSTDPHGIALRDCGPCLSDGPRVIDVLPDSLTAPARAVLIARLDHGVVIYGAPLRVGWAPAGTEAVQEAADLVNYLLAMGAAAPAGALDLAVCLLNLVTAAAIKAERSAP
jgi:hypothetical protein